MALLKLGTESVPRMVSLDTHGVRIINGWTVAISHEQMKSYLQQYRESDGIGRLNPGNGFYRDEINPDVEPFHQNGVLTHNGAKMAFNAGEFDQTIEWLFGQYGADLSRNTHRSWKSRVWRIMLAMWGGKKNG